MSMFHKAVIFLVLPISSRQKCNPNLVEMQEVRRMSLVDTRMQNQHQGEEE